MMTNKNKIYLFAVVLMIAAFFLTSQIIKGMKTSEFNFLLIGSATAIVVVAIFFISKWGKIENNK